MRASAGLSVLFLCLVTTMARAEPSAPGEATQSRVGLLRELLQERIAANVEIVSGLVQQRSSLLQLVALGDGATSAQHISLASIDRRVERLEREVDILRAELIALGVSADEPLEPVSIAELPEEAVQEALIYLGFYDGRIDGEIGRLTNDAIAGYQQSLGRAPAGQLTDRERQALLDDAAIRRRAYGMRSAGDDEVGYAFLYPSRLLPFERREGDGYRRFSSLSDKASLQVVSASVDRLETIYATLLARPGLAVAYNRLGDGWFVVAGEVGDMLFYDLARSQGQRLTRLRLAYPLAERAVWDPMTVILFNSFRLNAADEPFASQ